MHIIAKAETDYLYHLLVKINDKYRIVSVKNAGGFKEFYDALDILEYKDLNALLDHKEELMNDQALKVQSKHFLFDECPNKENKKSCRNFGICSDC